MNYALEGARLVFGDRSLWRYIWRPMAWSALLYLILMVIGLVGFQALGRWAVDTFDLARGWGTSAGTIAFVIVWFFLSGPIYLTVVGLISALAWDDLSRSIERKKTGREPAPSPSFGVGVRDTLSRLPFSIGMAIGTLIAGFACPPFALLLAGLLGLYDYSSSAYLRRGVSFKQQRRRAWKAPAAFGFLLTAGLVTLVPIVNVILFPAMVAGGTLLCLADEPLRPSSG